MNHTIGKNSVITANHITMGKEVKIGNNVSIDVEELSLGDFTIIGDNVNITCTSFLAGSWLYMMDGVEVGRGGCRGPNSRVTIGDHVGIFERTILNPSESITIGNDVGIGAEVMIWTHGAWLDLCEGFPAEFGPVTIGNSVWLPARCIVLPNVSIGDHTVIGINSIVNKNIPTNSLAGGQPCKVIRDNYPQQPTNEELTNQLVMIVDDWKHITEHKNIIYDNIHVGSAHQIILNVQGVTITYDTINKQMKGDSTPVSEDFRDYLRRRGIKIYTDTHFRSI